MKVFIKHRMNGINELPQVSAEWGVEIDLRSNSNASNELVVAHDPWSKGPTFQNWLKSFVTNRIKGPLFLNTKEDGLETIIEKSLAEHGIENYLFLDTTLPTLVKRFEQNKMQHLVRLSRYEPIEFAESFAGKAKWLWVDCFDGEPMDMQILARAKRQFKICLVSPELHGKPLTEIAKFSQQYELADAICTKNPESWRPYTK